MASRVNESNFKELVLDAINPVLLDFYSEGCIPCKRMSGIVADIEDTYESQIDVYKVNVNYESTLAEKYQVMTAPTFIALENGIEIGRLSGIQKKEEIIKLFDK